MPVMAATRGHAVREKENRRPMYAKKIGVRSPKLTADMDLRIWAEFLAPHQLRSDEDARVEHADREVNPDTLRCRTEQEGQGDANGEGGLLSFQLS